MMKRSEGRMRNYVEDDNGKQYYCEDSEGNYLVTRVRKLYRFLMSKRTGCPHQDEFEEVLRGSLFKVDEQKIWAFLKKMDDEGKYSDMLMYLEGGFGSCDPRDEIWCGE